MEFSLLIVEAVENVLKVTDFWKGRIEVWEKTDIKNVCSIRATLLVDGLDLLQKAIFLYFLVVKVVFKQVLIIHF